MVILEVLEHSINGQEENLLFACHPPRLELCIWVLKSINLMIIESARINALSGEECVESRAGHGFQ